MVAQGSGAGSAVPCAVPAPWSIERIDARFGLSAAEASRAAREAAALWERVAGTPLFDIARGGGSPIVFEYDERQATVAARGARERDLDRMRAAIEAGRGALESASTEHDSALRRYQSDVEEHRRAVRAYNDEVQRWNGREIPDTVEAELERRRREIDAVAEELQRRQRQLNRRSEEMGRDVEDFNRRVQELAEAQRDFARDFPATASESGTYDETVTWEDGRPVSVIRRITIHQFTGFEDLVLVLAHEMGHALGLGHAPGGGAIMSEVFTEGTDIVSTGRATDVDAGLLRVRCPGLGR